MWSSDTSQQDIRELASDQEEADTRIVLPACDAAARGYNQVKILCRDMDVLVLLLAHRVDLVTPINMSYSAVFEFCVHISQADHFLGITIQHLVIIYISTIQTFII